MSRVFPSIEEVKFKTFGAVQMMFIVRIVGLGGKRDLYKRVVVRRVTCGMRPFGLKIVDKRKLDAMEKVLAEYARSEYDEMKEELGNERNINCERKYELKMDRKDLKWFDHVELMSGRRLANSALASLRWKVERLYAGLERGGCTVSKKHAGHPKMKLMDREHLKDFVVGTNG